MQSIRELSLVQSVIKKRNKKNFLPKNDDYDMTEVHIPITDNNQGNINKIRELMDHHRREFSMENETKEIYSGETSPRDLTNHMQDPIPFRLSSDYHESDQFNFTDIPWPIVPGPIACELGNFILFFHIDIL